VRRGISPNHDPGQILIHCAQFVTALRYSISSRAWYRESSTNNAVASCCITAGAAAGMLSCARPWQASLFWSFGHSLQPVW